MLTNIGTQTIETNNLILRKFAYSDDEAMLKYWVADEKVQFMYLEPVYQTKEEVKGLLDRYIGGYSGSNYYRWAIISKENNECIGQIAYYLVDEKNNLAEMEYCISQEFQRKGLVSEAAKAVIKFGFEKINLHRIQICHKPHNIGSRKVIENSGFNYEGTLRDFFFSDGKYEDRLYYSILKDEYASK